jgi:ribose/xylose/arabinose/galactoside ABC-type transport system permease subunit
MAQVRRATLGAAFGQPGMNIVVVYAIVLAGCIAASLLFPTQFRFLTYPNLSTAMKSIPLLGIMSVGVGLLMITGQFDLSVGSIFTLSAMVTALTFNDGWPILIAVGAGLAVAVLAGVINGAITVFMSIPSFITTLGTMLVFRGSARYLAEGHDVLFQPDEWFRSLMTGTIGPIQAQFIWLLGVAVAGYLLLNRHWFGNHMFLVGGSERTALAIGINVRLVKMVGFILSALTTGISGIMSAVRVSSVSPSQGAGLELEAVAVCVIGGILLSGGWGTIHGIVLGACLLFTIQDVLLLVRAPGFYLDVFVGGIIIIAVSLNTAVARIR